MPGGRRNWISTNVEAFLQYQRKHNEGLSPMTASVPLATTMLRTVQTSSDR